MALHREGNELERQSDLAMQVWSALVSIVGCTSPDGRAELDQVRYLKALATNTAARRVVISTAFAYPGQDQCHALHEGFRCLLRWRHAGHHVFLYDVKAALEHDP